MGLVLGAIIVSWLILTVAGAGGTLANSLGVTGSSYSILLAILILGTGGILLAVRSRFTDGSTKSATRVNASKGEDEALEVLKQRYVAGEIDEATFERQLEALFETETVEGAKRRVENTDTSVERPPKQDPEPPVERGSPQPPARQVRRKKTRSPHGHCK